MANRTPISLHDNDNRLMATQWHSYANNWQMENLLERELDTAEFAVWMAEARDGSRTFGWRLCEQVERLKRQRRPELYQKKSTLGDSGKEDQSDSVASPKEDEVDAAEHPQPPTTWLGTHKTKEGEVGHETMTVTNDLEVEEDRNKSSTVTATSSVHNDKFQPANNVTENRAILESTGVAGIKAGVSEIFPHHNQSSKSTPKMDNLPAAAEIVRQYLKQIKFIAKTVNNHYTYDIRPLGNPPPDPDMSGSDLEADQKPPRWNEKARKGVRTAGGILYEHSTPIFGVGVQQAVRVILQARENLRKLHKDGVGEKNNEWVYEKERYDREISRRLMPGLVDWLKTGGIKGAQGEEIAESLVQRYFALKL